MKKKPQHRKWIGCDVEADYFGDDRKLSRKERKIASAKDRSKFKKTDQNKLKKQNMPDDISHLRRGRVLSIISQGLNVECDDKIYLCVLRGSLKKEKARVKNLVTVGDFVLFAPTSEDEGVIEVVEERHSYLSRADTLHQQRMQLIAANIDLVLITLSVVTPPIKPTIVDRYIIAARKGNMEPVIVVNKIDLLDEDPIEKEVYDELAAAWENTDIPFIGVSAESGIGLDKLRAIMKDKASVFSGQSGVGKSSLINAMTQHELETGKVVSRTKKGAHTTTQAQLLPLDFGGWVIDTPGIKSFGIWNLDLDEILDYFPDLQKIAVNCKYPDCSHTHEDHCAVKEAVEKETFPELRYLSYLYLRESIEKDHKPR